MPSSINTQLAEELQQRFSSGHTSLRETMTAFNLESWTQTLALHANPEVNPEADVVLCCPDCGVELRHSTHTTPVGLIYQPKCPTCHKRRP